MGVDWSADFRRELVAECTGRGLARRNLGEYILLGEVYDGACGHNWHTWGNPAFCEPEGATEEAPYKRDGWHVMELEDVSKWMVSRFASDVEECVCHSAAVSFSRVYALSEHTFERWVTQAEGGMELDEKGELVDVRR